MAHFQTHLYIVVVALLTDKWNFLLFIRLLSLKVFPWRFRHCWSQQSAGRVSFVNSAISQLNLKSPCGLMVEHRSAKREGLRFVRFLVEDSSSLMLLLFYSWYKVTALNLIDTLMCWWNISNRVIVQINHTPWSPRVLKGTFICIP